MNAMIDGATSLRSPVASYSATAGYMGDLVAWTLGNFKTKRTDLQDVFADCGFAGCVDERLADPAAALSEAARTGDKGRGIVVKEFARPNKDTMLSFGVYHRVSNEGETGDGWACGARVRVQDGKVEAMMPEGAATVPLTQDQQRCLDVATDIAKRANERIEYSLSTELSGALVAAGRSCYWAAFRKAGGAYWIHADYAAKFRRLLDRVEGLGEFWPTLQPLFGDEEGRTMRNVGAAANMAMVAALDELAADLAKAEGPGMKQSTIEARELRCQQLVLQADLYREALADKADKISARLADIRSRFGKLLNVNHDDAFDQAARELGDE